MVLGILTFLVIFEVGLSAGKVHSGVDVHGIDVGGLSRSEAAERLREYSRQMEKEPVVFVAEGIDCRFTRAETGWGPQPFDTADLAMEVGRSDAPFGALVDRLRAWFGGVTVEWDDQPNQQLVEGLVAECEESAASLGIEVEIDAAALETAIVDAVLEYPPEQIHQIPTHSG